MNQNLKFYGTATFKQNLKIPNQEEAYYHTHYSHENIYIIALQNP